MKHQEIEKKQNLARRCRSRDLFLTSTGIQCGNCLAGSTDRGATWKEYHNK